MEALLLTLWLSLIAVGLLRENPLQYFRSFRQRALLRKLHAGFDVFLHPLPSLMEIRIIPVTELIEQLLDSQDRILFLPLLQQFMRNILGWVMFGMAVHPHRFKFEEGGPFAGTGSRDGAFGGHIHGSHIVSIHDLTRHP